MLTQISPKKAFKGQVTSHKSRAARPPIGENVVRVGPSRRRGSALSESQPAGRTCRALQFQTREGRRRTPEAGLLNVNGTLYGTPSTGARATEESSFRSRLPARTPCSTASTVRRAKTHRRGSSTSEARSTARPGNGGQRQLRNRMRNGLLVIAVKGLR